MQDPNFTEFTEQTPKPDLVIPRTSLHLLMETSNWGKFLSIVGFIFVGLIAVFAFSFGFIFDKMDPEAASQLPFPMGISFTVIYLLMAVLYFFPCMYLFQFSRKIKEAVTSRDQIRLTEALTHQKSLYKFMGILTLVGLCIYALIFLFALAGFMLS